MMALNSSKLIAPRTNLPLIMKVGVLLIPDWVASRMFERTAAPAAPEVKQFLNLETSRLRLDAMLSNVSDESESEVNSASWYFQNAPCSPAQKAACAAGNACS